MSDDEEVPYVKKIKTIHYGSLEEVERARLVAIAAMAETVAASNEETTEKNNVSTATNSSASEALNAPQIHVSNEYMELEEAMSRDKQVLLEEFERRKKARTINVSTDDIEVKRNLRQLSEPICLFGEGPADRRNRLRDILSRAGEDAVLRREAEEERKQFEQDRETTWYHEGPESLRTARLWIANYSLPRAKQRLEAAAEHMAGTSTATLTAKRQEVQKRVQALSIYASQVGDIRPISFCQFSPNGDLLATASWSGVCKVWTVPDCQQVHTLRGHTTHVGAIVFHPKAALQSGQQSSEQQNICSLASCAADGTVKLWDFVSEEPIADIDGHVPHRVARIAFHPSGRFLGTCSFDCSWRLWDLHQCSEVLHQEGHVKPVYCISFQVDGSVCATGGMDAFGRVWDLRTGRCIMFMDGHQRAVLGIDFSPNGYQLATASMDNTCRIWDLRKRSILYTIPAHTNLVSDVKFQRENGDYLVTASYDNTVKLWMNRTWQSLKTLSGHDGKIMSVDVSPNSQYIATSSYDRTFKIWAPDYVT